MYKDYGDYGQQAQWLRDQGFCFGSGDGRPVGSFFDWMSVPQDKPKGSRTPEQTVAFKAALANINVWYAHAATITIMLTSLPPGLARADYDHSGWTNFERCVAGIISQSTNLLCIDSAAREKLLGSELENMDYLELSLKTQDKARGAPRP